MVKEAIFKLYSLTFLRFCLRHSLLYDLASCCKEQYWLHGGHDSMEDICTSSDASICIKDAWCFPEI